MNRETQLIWINEWKESKVKIFTPFHLHLAYFKEKKEFAIFFLIMSFGFAIIINPTKKNEKIN